MAPRSILVADDIENQSDAGQLRSRAIAVVASSLAKRLKTSIDLIYVEDLKSYPADRLGSFRFLAWHAQHQDRLDEISSHFGAPAHGCLKSGHPAEQILKAMRQKTPPELVVIGTQGRIGVKRLLLGSVAEEVVRHARRPVVVIGPAAQEKNQALTRQKQLTLLVATDLGKNSRPAEQYALSLAKRVNAKVCLFYCLWDSINAIMLNSAYSGMAAFNLDEIITETQRDALETMKRKVQLYKKHGVSCDYKIEDKALTSPCAVYQEAGTNYTLIVMGTHGRNALLNAFFGSTARETILHASVPVVVVHSGNNS